MHSIWMNKHRNIVIITTRIYLIRSHNVLFLRFVMLYTRFASIKTMEFFNVVTNTEITDYE